jgi:enoyl-CoA hydratase/carnithine racemase
MTQVVQVEQVERVVVMTLDRPGQLNAIDRQVLSEFDDALGWIESDNDVGAMVVTGGGRAFCAGADLAELSSLETGAEFRSWIHGFSDVLDRLVRCPKPSVAAVDGVAFGG